MEQTKKILMAWSGGVCMPCKRMLELGLQDKNQLTKDAIVEVVDIKENNGNLNY
jgi:hypothetical protein